MLQPTRTKFRKAHKGRIHGLATSGATLAFGQYGLAAMSHRGGVLGWKEPMPPAAKYALSYLYVQAEFGVCCPLSMTDALTRTIRN